MTIRAILTDLIPEKSTARITGILRDEAGAVIPGASLSTLICSIYPVLSSSTFINLRNKQSILNVNGGSVDVSGNWVFTLSPADNAISDITLTQEIHIILIEWTWPGGKEGRQEIQVTIGNMQNVP